MSHSKSEIYVHAVWNTKDKYPFLLDKKPEIISHIRKEIYKLECRVISVNGTQDHIHVLFKLNPSLALSYVIKQIKAETSHWINENNFYLAKFSWQIGYGAFSVSEFMVEKIDKYIRNQEEHHHEGTAIDYIENC